MHETTRLYQLILRHWQTHRPVMVEELERSNLLMHSVREAEIRAADLLHEFLSVRRMQYSQAWELAMQECLPPEETSSPAMSPDAAATSG
jgi:hypothetical protein